MQDKTSALFLLQSLHSYSEAAPKGIILAFWLQIPRTSNRPSQKLHLAIHRSDGKLIATLIPTLHIPPIGSVPRAAEHVLPHAVTLYLKRRLEQLGIHTVYGAVSNRQAQPVSYTANTRMR